MEIIRGGCTGRFGWREFLHRKVVFFLHVQHVVVGGLVDDL